MESHAIRGALYVLAGTMPIKDMRTRLQQILPSFAYRICGASPRSTVLSIRSKVRIKPSILLIPAFPPASPHSCMKDKLNTATPTLTPTKPGSA